MRQYIFSMISNGNRGGRQLLYRAALFAGVIFAGVLAAFMLMMWNVGIDGGRAFMSPEVGEASITALRISLIGFSFASAIASVCVTKLVESYLRRKVPRASIENEGREGSHLRQ